MSYAKVTLYEYGLRSNVNLLSLQCPWSGVNAGLDFSDDVAENVFANNYHITEGYSTGTVGDNGLSGNTVWNGDVFTWFPNQPNWDDISNNSWILKREADFSILDLFSQNYLFEAVFNDAVGSPHFFIKINVTGAFDKISHIEWQALFYYNKDDAHNIENYQAYSEGEADVDIYKFGFYLSNNGNTGSGLSLSFMAYEGERKNEGTRIYLQMGAVGLTPNYVKNYPKKLYSTP